MPSRAPVLCSVVVFCSLALCLTAGSACAQGAPAAPAQIHSGDVTFSGSVRTRSYSWHWFDDSAAGTYTYPGTLGRAAVSQSRPLFDWQVELAAPVMLNLPATALGSGAQGQLGLGASYFVANDRQTHTATLFIKQAAVRFKRVGGVAGQTFKVGRMEYNDGTEASPKNATLATLKRDRISQRLLGNFGFSDVGRSVDGVLYALETTRVNFTALAGRPTEGVFQSDGWNELKINVYYGAVTRQTGADTRQGEWRAFVLGYQDDRQNVTKTDNRPLATRTADVGSIDIVTYGGHYLQIVPTPAGPIDALAWGAVQTGSWGALTQRAGAFAAEVGWQPTGLDFLKPWIRAGYDYGSGSGDPASQTHGTFFQVLPTPRPYARLPFFNMMNLADGFMEVIVRPSKALTVRSDAHALHLADSRDLWYSGGGAFQSATFGYTGRPSNGQTALATMYDVSGDYAVSAHVAVGAYAGYASNGAVIKATYPSGGGARLGYLELLLKF